jgi:hypothetical protein
MPLFIDVNKPLLLKTRIILVEGGQCADSAWNLQELLDVGNALGDGRPEELLDHVHRQQKHTLSAHLETRTVPTAVGRSESLLLPKKLQDMRGCQSCQYVSCLLWHVITKRAALMSCSWGRGRCLHRTMKCA